jgi:hypothetical protein
MQTNEVFTPSDHFRMRQAQRGITGDMVKLALRYGKPFYEGSDRVYFLGRRQMPRGIDGRVADRANGTVVVVGPDDRLITTYRNPNFVKTLKRRQ